MSDQTMTGRVVGGAYRITGFQRPGRMGDIYVGRRIENNEIVSIKMMDPSMFGETEAIRRFDRETQITKQLNHPCSLVLLDTGKTEESLPYMVTEFVEGELLSDVIEEAERIEPNRAAYLAAQVAMALDAAHKINVVHRDLEPANILITNAEGQKDSVKVIEFGLSRLQETAEGEESTLTAVGVRIGMPYYMAPEYIEEYSLDHRADLYSLGIVIFEMLTGAPPFTGRPYKVMDKHLTETPVAPSSVADGVPAWLDALVADLLVKEPENRVQTANEVVRRIEEGLGERFQTVVAPAPGTPAHPSPRDHSPADSFPRLTEFAQSQVLSVSVSTGEVDGKEALVVHQVAANSIAAGVGVKRGMLCVLPDEPVTGMRDPRLWLTPVESRHYIFATEDGSTRIDLKCTGAAIGVSFLRSGRHIRQQFNPIHPETEALLDLWLQGDWESLEKLAMRTLSQQRGAAGVLNTGLFSRFLGGGGIKMRQHPALLLHGAAQVEQGRVNEGMEEIREYALEHAHHFDSKYSGIAQYYEAVELEKMGVTDRAVDLLVQGWLLWPNRRAADRIRHVTGKIPDSRAWYGRQFPDYTLDVVDQRGRTLGLYAELGRLASHQCWLVVMMGDERGNAGFQEVMQRYLAYAGPFGEFIRGMHLVTDTTERDPAKAEFHTAEDAVVAAGFTFEVLEDYRGFLRRAIKPASSPTVYAISKRGVVVHEGQLGSVELWNALSDLSRLSRPR